MLRNYIIEKYKKFMCLFMALFCVCVLSIKYANGQSILINSASMSSILFFVIFYILFVKAIEIYIVNKINIELIFGFIFACGISIGKEFLIQNTVVFKNIKLYLNIISLTLLFTSAIILLFYYMPQITNKLYTMRLPNFINNLMEKDNKKTFLYFFIILLLFWLPAFLALYPGYFSYDGPIQIEQYFTGHELNAWHPVIHTMTLVLCFKAGNLIFGNYSVGLSLYCLIQAIITATALSYCGVCMLRWKVTKIIVLLGIVFLGINPIIQIFVFTTTKDVIFGALFLVTILYTINLIGNKEEFFNKPILMIRYTAIVIIMSLFRKQGIFVFIFFVPVFIYISKNYWKKAVIISVISIISVFLFLGPISDSLGIIPGPVTETLSVPLQQIARVMNTNPDSLTYEEKEKVYKYIPAEVLETYIPQISDPIKDNFNTDEFKANKIEFLKLYLSVGIKNPGIYIDSFIYGTIGYFYPSTEAINPWGYVMNYYSSSVIQIEQHSLFPLYLKYLSKVGSGLLSVVPIASFFVGQFFPFWMFMISLALIIKVKKYSLIIPLSFIILYWLSLLLAPVCCIRYAYPLLISIPLIISMIFIKLPSCVK